MTSTLASPDKTLDVVGIGNAIVDVIVQADDSALDDHGLTKGTMALVDEDLAELMEVPIAIVSLGAQRDQTIVVEDPIHGPKRALLSA